MSKSSYRNSADTDIVDHQNRERTERLALKLARLKNVAVDIEQETRDHIPMLDDVDNSYQRTINALSRSQARLLGLLKSNRRGRGLFCYAVGLILLSFIAIYIILSFRTRTIEDTIPNAR